MAITKVTRELLSTGIDDNSNATAITIDSDENITFGGSSIFRSVNDSSFGLAGGTASNVGGNITLYGGASGIANAIKFRAAGTEVMRMTSDGLTFNGDTAAANALDDYEEGTFTPTWGGSSSVSVSSGNYGYYTKIGNVVTVHYGAVLSSSSNSYYQVTNLPFQSNVASGSCIGAGQEYGHTGYMYRNQIGDNSTTTHIVSYQNNAVANAYLQLSLTYRTD